MAEETSFRAYKYSKMRIMPLSKNCVTLHELVNTVHKNMSEMSGWEYKPLIPGMFGYDNMAVAISMVLEHIESCNNKLEDIEILADIVHQGWIENYTHWRDNFPWVKNPNYKRPFKDLGDEGRNKLADTPYSQLPELEKEKDRIIAKAILKIL